MENIRIALIDTGISEEYCKNKKINVKHYNINDNNLVEGYKMPCDYHAQRCADMILKDDCLKFDLFDICVMDRLEKISDNNLILGIKKAIDEHVDIINLSLGCNTYSPALFKVCEEAVENNIAIVAAGSHNGDVFYPANFKNVICVEVSNSQQELFKTIDRSTISISDKISTPFSKEEHGFSTSFAAAYFSGELGRLLNGYPFFDKFAILKNKFNLNISDSSHDTLELNYEKSKISKILETSKTAVVFDPCEDIDDFYKSIINPNIVAYYDYQSNKFKSFSCKEEFLDFDNILIINTLSHNTKMAIPNDIHSRFTKYKILYLGDFENIPSTPDLIYKHETWNSNNLVTLEKPIIMVTGFDCNFNKFDVSTQLFKDFEDNDIKTKVLTYNKKGVIYNFDVFDYPDKIIFPDIVGSINNYMNYSEMNNDFDMWIINTAGGNAFIDNKNRNNFGKLNESYFHAANIDVLIFCIDGFVDETDLDKWIKKINAFGISNILFVLSKNTVEPTSWDLKANLQTYKLGNIKYKNYFDSLKKKLNENLFSMADVTSGYLYNKVISLFN